MAENIKKITIGSESRNIEAAALGSENKGNQNQPIYLDKGVPKPCNRYAGGTCVTLNGGDFASRDIEICAPIEAGTGSDIITWDDDTGQPVWTDPNQITVKAAKYDINENEITTTYATKSEVSSVSSDLTNFKNEIAGYNYGGQIMTLQERATDAENAIQTLGNNYSGMSTAVSNLSTTVGNLSTVYLTQSGAAGIYLTSTAASSTYLTKNDAISTYLSKVSATSTYLSKTDASSMYLTTSGASSTYIAKSSGINVKKEIYYADLVDVYIENVSHAKVTITAGASKDTQSGDVEVDLGYGEQIVLLSPQMISPGATFELFFDKNTDICEVVCRDCYGECEKIIGTNSGDCSLGFDYTCDERDVYAMVELEWF